jgi:hypothetical protein
VKRRQAQLVALLALALSGCWFGDGLFADSDARAVLEPGVYRLTEPGTAAHDVTIAILPSGLTKLDDPEGDDGDATYGLVPVPGSSGRILGWFTKDGKPSSEQTQLYFLGEKRGDGFAFFIPGCDGSDGQIAIAAGAVVDGGSGRSCRFTNKASVLKAIANVKPKEDDRLVLTRKR